MSDELFERAAAARGRLLRVERLDPGGSGLEGRALAWLLTFDVGRVLCSADPATGVLKLAHVERPEDLPSGLEKADEEEPWWRLLGSPLVRAQRLEVPGGLQHRLQFRDDGDNPRFVRLSLEAGAARARLEPVGH